MRHLNEAMILTIRDGGVVDSDARSHLDDCTTCQGALSAAQMRSETIAQTLAALDGPVETTAAKAGVRARLRKGGSEHEPRRWGGHHLGRAAALLLASAAAAAALPWSPVRSLWDPPAPAVGVDLPAAVESEATLPIRSVNASTAGITVAVPDGFVQVVVRGAAPGSEISVTWTEEPTASLTAAPGSRFTYASGRVEVDASRGAVRLELPRDAGRVSLEVDGQLYLTGRPDALEVLGPAVERTDESILFRVAGR